MAKAAATATTRPPVDWVRLVNRLQSEPELKALREALRRASPYGSPQWQTRTARRLGLEWTLRPRRSVRGEQR